MNNPLIMPKIVGDFKADAIAIARLYLAANWPKFDAARVIDNDVLSYYFDFHRRQVSVRKRTVALSDTFTCPPDYRSGWNSLREKIVRGEDIRPHLHVVRDPVTENDGLLNEWGVHHFHLGIVPHGKEPGYVERTGPVLLAMVEDEYFYAIAVYEHKPPPWADPEIIETIHRNWPAVIRDSQVIGVFAENVTQDQRRSIRQNGGQTATGVSGGTAYASIGGPVEATGIKFESIRQADQTVAELSSLQSFLEAHADSVACRLQKMDTRETGLSRWIYGLLRNPIPSAFLNLMCTDMTIEISRKEIQ